MIRQSIAFAALLCWLGCLFLIVAADRWHFGLDETRGESQKRHRHPTPRSGGIAIVLGFAGGLMILDAAGYATTAFCLRLGFALAPLLPRPSGKTCDGTSHLGFVPSRVSYRRRSRSR